MHTCPALDGSRREWIESLLDRRADELPTQEAIAYLCFPEFGDTLNIRWTYRDYRKCASVVAKRLLALRLNRGDHIAVWAANLPVWSLLMMGAAYGGLMPQTREYILLAHQVGVPAMVVFLNKVNMMDGPESLKRVKLEVRELLSRYRFPGDDVPVIRRSALKMLKSQGNLSWNTLGSPLLTFCAFVRLICRARCALFQSPLCGSDGRRIPAWSPE